MDAIPIPARFGPGQTSSWIETWSKVGETEDLRLFVPTEARLEPAGIVLLAAGIARRRTLGLRTWMSLGRRVDGGRRDDGSGEAVRLLENVDFFRELGVETEVGPIPAPAETSVRLRRIASLEVARRQADATRELLERTVPSLPPSTIRAAQFVFEELAANVVQHSGAADTGFGLAIADAEARRIQVAFADAGVGFLASLRSNPEYAGRVADDAEAIRLALDKRVTRGGGGNIGMGLLLLSSFAERVHGDLWIATGDAMLVRRAEGHAEGRVEGAERRVEKIERTAGWRGAFLCLDAPVPGW